MSITSFNWEELLQIITNTTNINTSIRLLDTIFFPSSNSSNSNSNSWYFTTKNGIISKKNSNKVTNDSIITRFIKFSMSNPNNILKYVGTIIKDDGNKKYLTENELITFLSSFSNSNSNNNFLQVYLRPYNGIDQTIKVNYLFNNNLEDIKFTIQVGNREIDDLSSLPDSNFICDQSLIFTKEVVKSLMKIFPNSYVSSLQAEYIIDDNIHIWLSKVSNIKVTENNNNNNSNNNNNNNNENNILPSPDQFSTSLPDLPNSSQSQRKVTQSSTNDNSFNNNNNNNNHNLQQSSRILGKLLIREGGVYKSQVAPEDLPGLRAWILTSLSNQQTPSNNDWMIDLKEYNENDTVNKNSEIYQNRSSMTRTISNKMIFLIEILEPLLKGEIKIQNENDFINQWKTYYSDYNKLIKDKKFKGNNEVTVDGNCHAISRKIQSLIEINFEAKLSKNKIKEKEKEGMSRPHSESNLHDNKQKNNSSRSNPLELSSQDINRVKSSPALPLHIPETKKNHSNEGEHLPIHHEGEYDAESLASISVITENESNSLQGNSNKNKGSSKNNSKLNNNNNNNNSNNSNNSNNNDINGNGSKRNKNPYDNEINKKNKTKKDNLINSTPPNLEMLTKFAIEKEKQKKLQEENDSKYSLLSNDSISQDLSTQKQSKSTLNKKTNNKQKISGGGATTTATTITDNSYYNQYQGPISLEEEEKRLLELERIASAQSSGYRLGTGFAQTPFSFNTGQFSMTGTEEEFMLREIERGNTNHLHQHPNIENNYINNNQQINNNKQSNNNKTFDSDVINKLNEKLLEKDHKIKKLNDMIDERDKELTKREKKYNELNKKFIEFRSEAYEEKDRLKTTHETEILELKEQHAKHMSTFAINTGLPIQSSLPINNNMSNNNISNNNSPLKSNSLINNNNNFSNNNNQNSPYQNQLQQQQNGMTSLMEQLETLRNDNKKLSDKLLNEKKLLQNDYNLKMLTMETKYNETINKYKETIHSLEDDTMKLLTEKETLTLEIKSLTDEIHQNEQIKLNYQNQQKKLENDIKQLQNTINTNYKLESSQGIGIGMDADTAIKLNDLKNESKIRQLTNQIEFLKSQLSAELASVEEMKLLIETSKEKTELLKNDFRDRINELERQRLTDISIAEQRIELKYEPKIKEFNLLQNKFLQLQNQLQESFNEHELFKQKEEIQKNNSIKLEQQNNIYKLENENLKKQLNEIREHNDKNIGHDVDVNKHQQESLIRRIDNERQYLKSQLSSEILLKNELQNTLNICQQKLNDIQRQWNEDVEILRNTNKQIENESILIEQKLQQKISNLQTNNDHLINQINELKLGFIKQREQIRTEEINNENLQIQYNKLLQDNEILKEEIKNNNYNYENLISSYQNQINALTQTLQDTNNEKNSIILNLKEEIGKNFLEMSKIQKDSIIMKRELNDEKYSVNKKLEALRIYSSLTRYYNNHLGHYFNLWIKNSTLITATLQFKKKLKDIIKKKEDEINKDNEYKLYTQKIELENNYNNELKKVIEKYEEEKNLFNIKLNENEINLRKEFNNELNEKLNNINEENNIKLNEIENKNNLLINELNETNKIKLNELKKSYINEIKQQINLLNDKHEEDKLKLKQEIIKEITNDYEIKIQENEDIFYDKIKELEKKYQNDKDIINIKNNELIENEKNILKLYYNNEIKKLDEINNNKLNELKELYDNKINELLNKHEIDKINLINENKIKNNEILNEKINEIKIQLNKEIEEKLKQKDNDNELIIQQKIHEINIETNEIKNKLLKLETNKWQKILKETEKRNLLEIQQMKTKLLNELENKYKNEIESIQLNNERKLIICEEKYKDKIKEIENDTTIKIEKLMIDNEINLEIKLKEKTNEIINEMNESMENKIQLIINETKNEIIEKYNEKLLQENKNNEKLKIEIQQLQQIYSDEKRKLQTIIDTNDLRVQQKELKINELIENHNYKIEKLNELNKQNEIKLKNNLLKEFENEKLELIEKIKLECENELQNKFLREKEIINQQVEVQIDTIQKENEKLISNLEILMTELKNEKIKLNHELENLSNKLENTEDELFDTKQELIKLNKLNSINTWKNIIKYHKINNYYQNEIKKEKNLLKEIQIKLETNLNNKLEEFIYLCYKLFNIIYFYSLNNKKLNDIITKYKSSNLIEIKTNIKLYENELKNIIDEINLLNESKNEYINNLNELENEINRLEETNREINSNSSILQNGRINLLHSHKKKRIDTELERYLDLLEQKRFQIQQIENSIENLNLKKNEKEESLMEYESSLMKILIEQQKLVLNGLEEGRELEDRSKMILKLQPGFVYPPPENPTKYDIDQIIQYENQIRR